MLVRTLLQFVLPLAAAGGLFAGVWYGGQLLQQRGRDSGLSSISFTDLECNSPPGLTRLEFLSETQYLSGLPELLDTLDPQTVSRVHHALSLHPWVDQVTRVQILPSRRLRAQLVFRLPVLAVRTPPRVVDAQGVLLPRQAPTQNLPVLVTAVTPPKDPAGVRWSDIRVCAAAQVVALLQPHLSPLGLNHATVDVAEGEILFRTPKFRLLWGRPPGLEKPDEAPAARKLERLRSLTTLEGQQWDLRPLQSLPPRPLR